MKTISVLAFVYIVVVVVCFSGCAGSTGWRFEIGVSPVKSLNNQAGLTQEATQNGKY